MLDEQLLKILACPACRSEILYRGNEILCTNAECRRVYPVRDEIPVMLVDESTVGSEGDWPLGDAAQA